MFIRTSRAHAKPNFDRTRTIKQTRSIPSVNVGRGFEINRLLNGLQASGEAGLYRSAVAERFTVARTPDADTDHPRMTRGLALGGLQCIGVRNANLFPPGSIVQFPRTVPLARPTGSGPGSLSPPYDESLIRPRSTPGWAGN